VCNTESIFLCVSTSEAEPPPPATHYHFNHCVQACAKFDVSVEEIAGSSGRYRVTIVLGGDVDYSQQKVYAIILRAEVCVRSRTIVV